MTSLQELNDEYIRPLNLDWRLDDRSKRRLMQAAALPAALILAMLARALLEYAYGLEDLVTNEFGAPELVKGFYRAVYAVDTLTPAAVAVLFLAGLRRWSRAEASWMLLAGGLLGTIAVAFGSMYTLALTVSDDQAALYDLRVDLWYDLTQTFGLLAIGFFFVAHRGLSAPDETPDPIADS